MWNNLLKKLLNLENLMKNGESPYVFRESFESVCVCLDWFRPREKERGEREVSEEMVA